MFEPSYLDLATAAERQVTTSQLVDAALQEFAEAAGRGDHERANRAALRAFALRDLWVVANRVPPTLP
jgi:hypothetical protein